MRDTARSLVRLKRPERLLKMITRFLSKELGLTHAAILVLNSEKGHYTIFDSRGLRKLPRSLIKFDSKHPLIQWFGSEDKETASLRSWISNGKIQSALQNGHLGKNHTVTSERLRQLQRVLQDLRVSIVIPGHFKDVLVGVLLIGDKLSRRIFTEIEIQFFQTLVHDMAMAIKTGEYQTKEKETFKQIVKSLAQQIHAKDPYTFGHIHQVEQLGLMTAWELKLELTAKRKATFSAGLLLHDVGKVGIPDQVLKKPASLDLEEWKVMRSHVEKGVKILEPLSDFKEAAEIVHCHHENYDGSGYPRGLKGEKIPIEARIVSVVDAFHAIVSDRCYRKGRPQEVAFEELRRCSNSQFDSQVVEAFIRGMKKQRKIKPLMV